jgi:hypothetical protein
MYEEIDGLETAMKNFIEKFGPMERAPWHERIRVWVANRLIRLGEHMGGFSDVY